MFVLMPFTYAVNQNTQFEVEPSNIASSTAVTNVSNEEYLTSAPKFILREKVKSGVVQEIESENDFFTLKVGNKLYPIEYNASTTFYLGKGDLASLNDLQVDMKIYVFGYIKSDDSAILATKVVMANKSRLQRK